MGEFLTTVTQFPTVIFTVMLGVSALYWLLVIAGAVGLDSLDLDLDGDLDVDLDLDVDVDGAIEGGADGAANGFGTILDILGFSSISNVPLTIWAGLFSVWGWLISGLGMLLAGPTLSAAIGGLGAGTVVFLAAFLGAARLSAITSKPFAPLMQMHKAKGNDALVGQTCIVKTGRVSDTFGQGEVKGGAGYLIQIRCDQANALARNSEALLVDYDAERQAFVVEPMDVILTAKDEESGADAVSASAVDEDDDGQELAAAIEAAAEAQAHR